MGILDTMKRMAWRAYWRWLPHYIDRRFGDPSAPRLETRLAAVGSYNNHSLGYYWIREAMRHVSIGLDDVLVDVGCACGAVLNWWLYAFPRNRLVGIELDTDMAAACAARLKHFSNVQILCGDAVELTPAESTVCFLANPFDASVMDRWQSTIAERSKPGLRVIYANCRHAEAFEQNSRWKTRRAPFPRGDLAMPEVLVAELL